MPLANCLTHDRAEYNPKSHDFGYKEMPHSDPAEYNTFAPAYDSVRNAG